jgi:four helix bundle protein
MSKSFEDSDVWKESCALSVQLYALSKTCRDFGLKDQMLRASISIASNVAEGSERKNIPDFKRFVSTAQGSAAE